MEEFINIFENKIIREKIPNKLKLYLSNEYTSNSYYLCKRTKILLSDSSIDKHEIVLNYITQYNNYGEKIIKLNNIYFCLFGPVNLNNNNQYETESNYRIWVNYLPKYLLDKDNIEFTTKIYELLKLIMGSYSLLKIITNDKINIILPLISFIHLAKLYINVDIIYVINNIFSNIIGQIKNKQDKIVCFIGNLNIEWIRSIIDKSFLENITIVFINQDKDINQYIYNKNILALIISFQDFYKPLVLKDICLYNTSILNNPCFCTNVLNLKKWIIVE